MSELIAAAQRRAQVVAQRSHRPSQRRAQESGAGGGLVGVGFRSEITVTTREAKPTGACASCPQGRQMLDCGEGCCPEGCTAELEAPPLRFVGLASATGQPYEMWDAAGPYLEVVEPGAFTATLARADLDVPLVIGHDQIRRIARTILGTLQLSEDPAGLAVTAQLDPDDEDVEWIAPKIACGLLNEMSFAFRIVRGSWSPDYTTYTISEVDLHRGDVSIVGYGANPYTSSAIDDPRNVGGDLELDAARVRMKAKIAAAL